MRPRTKRIIRISIAVAAFIFVFWGIQRLLMPKYASSILEGNLIREYYQSAKSHDIIFIGDCEIYAGFSPITLWDDFGITSFLRGSPQQLIWQSYYLLHDTLRHETPQVVVFNVLTMQYNEPQSEPYNRLTLDGMRNSPARFRAIAASRTDEEDWLSHIFPLFRYKDRWREISGEDFRHFFHRPQVSVNGFMVRADAMPVGFLPDPLRRGDYSFGDKAWYYLERMVRLAEVNDIQLVLVKAPTLFPYWHSQWNDQIADFAAQHGLLYINFLEHMDEIGLDWQTDTFNGGLHLNVFGAQKVARFFGPILQQEFDILDRRSEAETAAHWGELSELYHRIIARQLAEIGTYGRIQCFLAR